MARRIADHIAVAVSHERLSKAGGHAASPSSGRAGVDDTVRTVCAEIRGRSRTIIVGQSADWQGVLKKAVQVAATDTTVLVSGESGTGKEVVARFIHQASARKGGPFVALNCAALPEQLLEAELFGHERGAFTGAQQAKPRQIELAAGGVLFRDEVSETAGRSPIPVDGDQRDVVCRLESGAPGLDRLQNARQQLPDLTARGGAQIYQPRKSEFFVVPIARLDHPVGVHEQRAVSGHGHRAEFVGSVSEQADGGTARAQQLDD
jgi:hypothetical protein